MSLKDAAAALTDDLWASLPIAGITLSLGGNCPVQGTGAVTIREGNRGLYFRASDNEWHLEIDGVPVAGGDSGGGEMSVSDAMRKIAGALDDYEASLKKGKK